MMNQIVRVSPGNPTSLEENSYEIIIGADILSNAGTLIKENYSKNPSSIFIITDQNLANQATEINAGLAQLTASLEANFTSKLHKIILPAGEATKSFTQLEALLANLFSLKLDRSSLLIAYGGGVIGDLTGFCASIALRGIDFIQIPTTLLSQVDSSVGGKTGINSKAGKNLIGAFYQPKLVIADCHQLKSLPLRELKAGYAEVVKYGVIDDVAFFTWLETHGEGLFQGNVADQIQAIVHCCQAKARIVAADERENGVRALLNLGHSFAHAMESALGYDQRLLHGEAVAVGMVLALRLSYELGICPEADVKRLIAHLKSLGLPTHPHHIKNAGFNAEILCELMSHDKKMKAGQLTLILAHGIGKSFLNNQVQFSRLTQFWQAILKEDGQ